MKEKNEKKSKSQPEIERAWKDTEYRESLDPEQKAQIPANPVELGELEDDDLEDVSGGTYTVSCFTS